MATRIRLRRVGRKKLPLYRIVVADQEVAARRALHRDASAPTIPKGQTAARRSRSTPRRRAQWIAKGATPSDTVQSLLKQAGVFKPRDGADRRPDAPPTWWSGGCGSRTG